MAVGVVPIAGAGFGMIDQSYALGVAQDRNNTYQTGIAAAVTTGSATGATQLAAGSAFYSIDTSTGTNNDSILLPPALAGMQVQVFNNTANTIDVFGTTQASTQDKINNVTTAFALTTYQSATFTCAKAAQWAGNKSA